MERITVWLYGAGGAPCDEFIRIDYDPDDEISSALPVALDVLSSLAPRRVMPGYVMRLDHDIKQSRVTLESAAPAL
jgi:hypothetical protein